LPILKSVHVEFSFSSPSFVFLYYAKYSPQYLGPKYIYFILRLRTKHWVSCPCQATCCIRDLNCSKNCITADLPDNQFYWYPILNTVELGYNGIRGTEYFMSLWTIVVLTEEYNVTVNNEELQWGIRHTKYLMLWSRCGKNRYRYNGVLRHINFVTAFRFNNIPTDFIFIIPSQKWIYQNMINWKGKNSKG